MAMLLNAGRCGILYAPCAVSTSYQLVDARTQRRWRHQARLSRSSATPSSRPPAARVEEDPTPADGEVVSLETPLLPAASSAYEEVSAFVAGATGGTGREIVARLLREGVPVRALVRDANAAASVLPRAVELYQGDVYQFATLEKALGDANVLFIATGSRPALDPFGPFNVDYEGTVNLVEVARRSGVKRVVLVSSIGADDSFFPLNLLFGVLFWKKRGEEALQRSGLPYTIVRPGGLLNAPRQGQIRGNIVMAGPNSFGLPPKRTPGSILRSQVADICVESLIIAEAENKVVEVVTSPDVPARPIRGLFALV